MSESFVEMMIDLNICDFKHEDGTSTEFDALLSAGRGCPLYFTYLVNSCKLRGAEKIAILRACAFFIQQAWDKGYACGGESLKHEALRSLPYQEYLQTEHWRETSKKARYEAGNRCQLCNTNHQTLHVHHRTYERIGCESSSDLIVLCESCHGKFHDKLPTPPGASDGEGEQ